MINKPQKHDRPIGFKTLDDLDRSKIIRSIEALCKKYKVSCVIPDRFWKELQGLILDCHYARELEDNRKVWLKLKRQLRGLQKKHSQLKEVIAQFSPIICSDIQMRSSPKNAFLYSEEYLKKQAFTSPTKKYSTIKDVGDKCVNGHKFTPPLDNREIEQIANSIAGRELRRREVYHD